MGSGGTLPGLCMTGLRPRALSTLAAQFSCEGVGDVLYVVMT